MKTNSIKRISVVALLLLAFCASTYAQTDREWWNSLSPGWKKIFRDIKLKGKDVDPTDGQLETFSELVNINCNGNKDISDLTPLSRLPGLTHLDCSNTSIQSLDGIQALRNLTWLNCSNNDNISSLKPIAGLINLETLDCSNTMVPSLAPLTYLKKLRRLDVHLCTISNLAQISELKNLTYLDVSQNHGLYSIAGVEKIAQLAEFNCSDTYIDDLTPLASLKMIETLNISNTKVTTLRPLQFVRSLIEIDCSKTKISAASLDYFTSHFKLKFLRGRDLDIDQKSLDEFTSTFAKRVPECDVILTKK